MVFIYLFILLYYYSYYLVVAAANKYGNVWSQFVFLTKPDYL